MLSPLKHFLTVLGSVICTIHKQHPALTSSLLTSHFANTLMIKVRSTVSVNGDGRKSTNATHCTNKRDGHVLPRLRQVIMGCSTLQLKTGLGRRAEMIYLFCMQLYWMSSQYRGTRGSCCNKNSCYSRTPWRGATFQPSSVQLFKNKNWEIPWSKGIVLSRN